MDGETLTLVAVLLLARRAAPPTPERLAEIERLVGEVWDELDPEGRLHRRARGLARGPSDPGEGPPPVGRRPRGR